MSVYLEMRVERTNECVNGQMNDCRQRGAWEGQRKQKGKADRKVRSISTFLFLRSTAFEAKVLRRLPNPHVASLRAKDACVRGVKHAYGLP